jgi:hypothetical protein
VSQISGLTVRQHEREGIEVPVEFTIDPDHSTQVCFSPSSCASGPQTFRCKGTDISSGGMGLQTRIFLPRGCEGTVRAFAPGSNQGGDTGGEPELLLEHRVKIRRVTLVGRDPVYSIGCAFIDPTAELDRQINNLFNRIQGEKRAPAALKMGGAHA